MHAVTWVILCGFHMHIINFFHSSDTTRASIALWKTFSGGLSYIMIWWNLISRLPHPLKVDLSFLAKRISIPLSGYSRQFQSLPYYLDKGWRVTQVSFNKLLRYQNRQPATQERCKSINCMFLSQNLRILKMFHVGQAIPIKNLLFLTL